MSEKESPNTGSILAKLGLRPFTKCNIARFYVPAFGVSCYTLLSVNVMNPRLAVRIMPHKDVTSFLLFSAFVGSGLYLYTRDHVVKRETPWRIAYSFTGAILFSFGSVLSWAVLRSFIPPNPVICTIAGIGSGMAFITCCHNYLDFVDKSVKQ